MALKLTHWEYSFILHTTELGVETRTTTNPFTGEQMKIPIDKGLTSEQIDAVNGVLKTHKLRGSDPETHSLKFESGPNERVSFYNVDFVHGKRICDFEASVLTKQLQDRQLGFIWDIARAGKFALMSGIGEHVRLAEQTPTALVAARWPQVETLSGISELRWWFQNVLRGRKCAVVL